MKAYPCEYLASRAGKMTEQRFQTGLQRIYKPVNNGFSSSIIKRAIYTALCAYLMTLNAGFYKITPSTGAKLVGQASAAYLLMDCGDLTLCVWTGGIIL
jgi:hypothetical protein